MWHHKQNYNLNQRGTNMIHDIAPIECDKCLSTTTLKHANVLSEVNKWNGLHLFNIMPYKKYAVLYSK